METLSFVLAAISVFVAPLASLVTLRMSNRHASEQAEKERRAAERQAKESRTFDWREARFSERKSAALDLALIFEEEIDRIDRFYYEGEYGGGVAPGDVYPERSFVEVTTAVRKLQMIANADVAEAATNLQEAIFDRYNDREPKPGNSVDESRAAFFAACRKLLTADAE